MTCSARCRAPAPNWRRGCCRNWGAIAIDSTLPKTCSVTVGPRRSVISPAQSIRSGFAARATRRSEPPSTCGPTAAGTPARGPRLTTRAFANGANPTHAPYDASANAGSKSCGRCGKPAPATMRSSIRKTSSDTGLGCSNCRPPNRLFPCQ